MSLDVKKLIQKTQDLMEYEDLPSVVTISYLVQKVDIDGQIFELRVSLEPEHIVLDGPPVDPKLN